MDDTIFDASLACSTRIGIIPVLHSDPEQQYEQFPFNFRNLAITSSFEIPLSVQSAPLQINHMKSLTDLNKNHAEPPAWILSSLVQGIVCKSQTART